MVDPEYERIDVGDGEVLAARFVQLLEKASADCGVNLLARVTQGSYKAGDGAPQSKGFHDRGGTVDLRVKDLGQAEITRIVKALRLRGCIAWHRRPEQFSDPKPPPHIHGVDRGANDLSEGAAGQVTSFKNGGNGLKGNPPDDGPLVVVPVYVYEEEDPMAGITLEQIGREVWGRQFTVQAGPNKGKKLSALGGLQWAHANVVKLRVTTLPTLAKRISVLAQGQAAQAQQISAILEHVAGLKALTQDDVDRIGGDVRRVRDNAMGVGEDLPDLEVDEADPLG